MDISIAHPVPMIAFLVAHLHFSFALFGFIIGIVLEGLPKQLQLVPLLVIADPVSSFSAGRSTRSRCCRPTWQDDQPLQILCSTLVLGLPLVVLRHV